MLAREIAHYTDIEKGKNPDRPELVKAIAHAKLANATLVVAKLDRLARNVAFLATLMESKVKFVCCDCPGANTFTIHILAAVAQEEARLISERTKKASRRRQGPGRQVGIGPRGTLDWTRASARLQEGDRTVGNRSTESDGCENMLFWSRASRNYELRGVL